MLTINDAACSWRVTRNSRPEDQSLEKAKKTKYAAREDVRTLSVVFRHFIPYSPRAHGHMTDSAYREDHY